MKKVIIIGGGFAGLETAIYLKKEEMDVTLISNRDYLYIYPISIWVPTKEYAFEDVCISFDALKKAHGFEVIIDEVESIKVKEKKIQLKNQELIFDYLVIAIGADKVTTKGIEHTLSICGKPEDALKIRDKIDELITKKGGKIAIGFGGNKKDPSAVRGGPAFEFLFNIHHLLKKRNLRRHFEITFFAPMEQPGKRMGELALNNMGKIFDKLDITTHFGEPIIEFVKDGVLFEKNKVKSDFTMYIPAGTGPALFKNSDLPLNDAGFIDIDDYCQVNGIDNVFALGDTAALEGPPWRAKQGHVAEVMARNTAFNITCIKKGSPKRKGYQAHLNIICLMDNGNGASFVYRNDKTDFIIPMPIVGHWLKKAWGYYYKLSKLGKIPRIPGM